MSVASYFIIVGIVIAIEIIAIIIFSDYIGDIDEEMMGVYIGMVLISSVVWIIFIPLLIIVCIGIVAKYKLKNLVDNGVKKLSEIDWE